MPHTEETRRKISQSALASESFQATHRRRRGPEERAAISASRRVNKEEDPDLWQQIFDKALKRITLMMKAEEKTSDIAEQERELLATAKET